MGNTIITKAIPGYEGLYEVDTLGRVWSLRHPRTGGRKQLKGSPDTKGYIQVVLIKDKVRKISVIHRIVGMVFIPNPDNKPQINHKDGNKKDNSVDNLEWMTNSENALHAYKVLGKKAVKGEKNARSKLSEKQVMEIWYARGKKTLRQLSNEYNVTMAAISLIHKQKTWKWFTDEY